jgi:molybdopterin-guanine dinucleotide biosynthesis protein B
MRVAAVTGLSGTGKTTLIEALIRRYASAGVRMAAIKHTHHPLPSCSHGATGAPACCDRTDTARFATAGAAPVILAADAEALIDDITRVTYDSPLDLLAHVPEAAVVLIEGFKHFDGWPRIDLVPGRWPDPAEVAANLDRIWRSS